MSCSYIAFSSFNVWNAWYRVWSLGGLLNVFRIKKLQDKARATGDIGALQPLHNPKYLGSLCPNLDDYEELFTCAASLVECFGQGKVYAADTASQILKLFDRPNFVPPQVRNGKGGSPL